MKRRILLVLFSLLLILPSSLAQVGVGITSYRINLEGKVGQEYVQSIGIMNPSAYTTTVRVKFECGNCVEEVKIFGWKLFEKVEKPTEYFTLDKEVVEVPPNTDEHTAVPVKIVFRPKLFVFKEMKFYTPEWLNFFIQSVNPSYGGSFSIPYVTFLVGGKQLSGAITADVVGYAGGPLGVIPSVAATLEMKAYGMPLGSFIFLVLIILVILSVILYKNRKRIAGLYHKIFKKKS
jgi:hypothetical protein